MGSGKRRTPSEASPALLEALELRRRRISVAERGERLDVVGHEADRARLTDTGGNEKSLALLSQCGLNFDVQRGRERLLYQSADFPIDLMLVRDDDIPTFVNDGACELGIVGRDGVIDRRGHLFGKPETLERSDERAAIGVEPLSPDPARPQFARQCRVHLVGREHQKESGA